MTMYFDLPQPTVIHLERSHRLVALLRERILQQDGYISFADYMQQVLYHPQLGYYNREDFALGKEGDFITAPHVSPLFAQCFAKQCSLLLFALGGGDLLEIGAGSGHFAADILAELQRLEALPDHYYIYETAPTLRRKQLQFLQVACPEFYTRIVWLEQLPDVFNGIVIANEVLDALPVHCFSIVNHESKERCVGMRNNQLVWELHPPRQAALREKLEALQSLYSLSDYYSSEIHLAMPAFIETLVRGIKCGVMLFADYGYGQREYYHPERKQGTLTCFYRQHRHADPLILPGLQDITAHVNFTDLIECAATHGCTLEGYTSQAAFLMNCGLIGLAEENQPADIAAAFQQQQAIKTLTMPTEMGERIKVMAIGKNLPAKLSNAWIGFQAYDRSRDL